MPGTSRWLLSDELGPMASGGQRQQVFLGEEIAQHPKYSKATARQVDEEVKRILDESYQRAFQTLEEKRQGLDRLAEQLLEEEELPGDDVADIIDGQQED